MQVQTLCWGDAVAGARPGDTVAVAVAGILGQQLGSRRRAPSPSKFDSGPPLPPRQIFSPFPVEAVKVLAEGIVLQGIVGEVWADFVNEAMEGMMVARRKAAVELAAK